MKIHPTLLTLGFAALPASPLLADGAFYGDPPDENHPWAIHDMNRPQPPRVEPATPSTQEQPGKPPSDAVVLMDGTEATLSKWEADKSPAEATKWVLKDGAFQCVPGAGYVRTKEQFGDCQLHVEWAAPAKPEGSSQGRGNSGIFLMGIAEIQELDNFNNPTYADGFAGSLYGINAPMANALRPPGEWQSYDIVFRRPIFKDGKEIDPGYVTVIVNGVLVQDHTIVDGGGTHRARTKPRGFPEKGPLKLQDHGNPVRYRNIWYRPLPPRPIEGGTDGRISAEATTAKRAQIAAGIRADAEKLQGMAKTLRVMESLCYAPDEAALKTASADMGKFVAEVSALPPEKQDARKGEVMHVNDAIQYLVKFKLVSDNFPGNKELPVLIKQREWDKKKK